MVDNGNVIRILNVADNKWLQRMANLWRFLASVAFSGY
jgi:hypothetical protein